MAMSDLELAVRTIESVIPDMPTDGLQKWKSILQTAILKIDKELTSTTCHTCVICFFEEWGYRDELPVSWYKKGGAVICFNHEYSKAEELLRANGWVSDADEPIEIANPSQESIKLHMKSLPPQKTESESTLEELMELL